MDLRTARTKKSIQDAFLALRKKKPIERITVKEIADIAMINKSTFYRHYEDIYKLSDEIENMVIDKIIENFNYEEDLITELVQSFAENWDVYSVVFSGNRMNNAIKKLHDKFIDIMVKSNPKLENDLEKRVIISSIIYGNFNVYTIYQNEDSDIVLKGIQKASEILKEVIK